MNGKFDHLMYESGLTADGCWDQMDTYDKEAIMKFAELIVHETLIVATAGLQFGPSMQEAVYIYFGVKE